MQKAPVAVHHPSACSGLKACPWLEQGTQAPLSGKPPSFAKRFGPLTPSARSANLIAGDGKKNGIPAPNKESPKSQK